MCFCGVSGREAWLWMCGHVCAGVRGQDPGDKPGTHSSKGAGEGLVWTANLETSLHPPPSTSPGRMAAGIPAAACSPLLHPHRLI